MDGLYYFGFSFWMEACISMFDNSYMIPPQGGDRRGPIVTREGKGKYHWIVLPARYQVGPGQSQLPLIDAFFPDLLHCYFVDL